MKHAQNVLTVKVAVILFKENNVTIAYSPAVNVYGYGETETTAKRSFEIALEEFFRYAINKKTLKTELEALGWKVKGAGHKCTPPDISTSLNKNAEFKSIFNLQKFKKIDKGITLPLIA